MMLGDATQLLSHYTLPPPHLFNKSSGGPEHRPLGAAEKAKPVGMAPSLLHQNGPPNHRLGIIILQKSTQWFSQRFVKFLGNFLLILFVYIYPATPWVATLRGI
jgi:hypothetical protein